MIRNRHSSAGNASGSGERNFSEHEAWRLSQESGLATLMAIATQAPLIGDLPDWHTRPSEQAPPLASPDYDSQAGYLRRVVGRFRADHLVRNSFHLMISYGAQAGLGFVFWIIVARLFSTADVGRASSLISATTLISFFALFGLNTVLVRYLPTARNGSALVTTTFILCALAGAFIGIVYAVLTPVFAPRLSFVDRPLEAVGFALLAGAASLNVLTDSVFIAKRRASFCAITDGAVGGVTRIFMGVALAGTGAYGLFCASVGGSAAAALASILLLVIALRWRPTVDGGLRALRPLLRFSAANYAASAMTLLPSVVIPIVVLDRLGPKAAGYYFVAFQMALLLYTSIYAVENAFLAEGSQARADWRAIRRRSRRLATAIFVPGAVALAAGSRWLLLAFGTSYSEHGTGGLEFLAAAVLPLAVCNWSWTVLRLSGRLIALTVCAAAYAIGICGAAWILAPHGLTAVCGAWFVGGAFAACVATVPVLVPHRGLPARHSRARASSI